MDWICKKCGKTLEVSEEQLYEMQGVVICPQCLGSDLVPGYRRKSTTKTANQSSSNSRAISRQPSTTSTKPTPPTYRKKTNQVERTSTATSPRTAVATPKKKKKKRKKRGALAPNSSWGCLWRSVLYTLIFLLIITIIGLSLDLI
ncbi:MAG: hypothetical protein J6S96_03610 [Muribaculaceae bacterium]|nr:hypothetical protein [Muribaculaceae bacterium]